MLALQQQVYNWTPRPVTELWAERLRVYLRFLAFLKPFRRTMGQTEPPLQLARANLPTPSPPPPTPGLRRPGTETDFSPPYCHFVILHGVVIKQHTFSFSFTNANDVWKFAKKTHLVNVCPVVDVLFTSSHSGFTVWPKQNDGNFGYRIWGLYMN